MKMTLQIQNLNVLIAKNNIAIHASAFIIKVKAVENIRYQTIKMKMILNLKNLLKEKILNNVLIVIYG